MDLRVYLAKFGMSVVVPGVLVDQHSHGARQRRDVVRVTTRVFFRLPFGPAQRFELLQHVFPVPVRVRDIVDMFLHRRDAYCTCLARLA